jgi:hypothetical protein
MNVQLVESLMQVILSLPDEEQEILEQKLSSRRDTTKVTSNSGVNKDASSTNVEATFKALVNQWREETRGISSTDEMSMHPAYQSIIGMGEVVVPLLLRELENKTGRWFWALKSITREDPVPPEYKGKTQEMIRAWLEWGKQRGYQW